MDGTCEWDRKECHLEATSAVGMTGDPGCTHRVQTGTDKTSEELSRVEGLSQKNGTDRERRFKS